MNIAEKIKECRKRNGLTQMKLSQSVGVSPMTVRRWEWNERSPELSAIPKLAEALNTSVEYLMGLNEHNNDPESHSQEIPPHEDNGIDLLATGGMSEDKLIIDDKKAGRVYYFPNNEEGRKLFLYVMTNGLNGMEPPLVANTINGNNNTENKMGLINN